MVCHVSVPGMTLRTYILPQTFLLVPVFRKMLWKTKHNLEDSPGTSDTNICAPVFWNFFTILSRFMLTPVFSWIIFAPMLLYVLTLTVVLLQWICISFLVLLVLCAIKALQASVAFTFSCLCFAPTLLTWLMWCSVELFFCCIWLLCLPLKYMYSLRKRPGDESTTSGTQPPNSTGTASHNVNNTSRQTRRKSTQGKSEDSGDKPPSKKGRKSSVHNHKMCGPCSVWVQLGSDHVYLQHHSGMYMSHPQFNFEKFSAYLSTPDHPLHLQADSCMCLACYNDACKYADSATLNRVPRWV